MEKKPYSINSINSNQFSAIDFHKMRRMLLRHFFIKKKIVFKKATNMCTFEKFCKTNDHIHSDFNSEARKYYFEIHVVVMVPPW